MKGRKEEKEMGGEEKEGREDVRWNNRKEEEKRMERSEEEREVGHISGLLIKVMTS